MTQPIEESDLEQDRRTTGTFAEGQQRLARAIDCMTSLALRRVSADEELA